MRRLVLLAGLGLGLVPLGACGSSSERTTTVTRTVTHEAAPPPRPSSGGSGSTTGGAPPGPHGSEAPARFVHATTFRSPTGNIGCVLLGGQARCDIRERSWKPPAAPANCRLDYGQGLVVGHRGRARFVCAGDTALDPGARVVPYGTASDVGRFVCVSRTSGVTCTNARTGHGFLLRREGYKLF